MAVKILDESDSFDFDKYFEDDEAEEKELNEDPDIDLVYANEEEFDKLLDLHNDIKYIGYEAQYPYLFVSGFLTKYELLFMAERLNKCRNELKSIDDESTIPILLDGGQDLPIEACRLPLNLDTILIIIGVHRYDIFLVQSEDNMMPINSNMMKALIFT